MTPSRPGLPVYVAAVLGPILCGLYAVWLGADANWDLRNYHFYNAYALIHGRRGFDLAVAHHATFYNPFSDLPFYALVQLLPPHGVGFAMGLLHGLNFVIVLAMAWRLLATAPPVARRWGSIAVAGLGMAGAVNLSELGTTFHDNLISLFALGSLLGLVLYYRHLVEAPTGAALRFVLLMGLLAGIGAGLKQPSVVFALGACAALLLVTAPFTRRFLLSFTYGVGVLGGIALGGGWWIWRMWVDYGNPLFPYYNQVFKSPWAIEADYLNREMLPKSLVEALFYPILFTLDPKRVSEAPFFDLRAALVYVLAIAALAAWPLRRRWIGAGTTTLADRHPANLVLAASLVAYLAWLKVFGVYRYLAPLEMLAPLLVLLLVDRLALTRWLHGAVLGGAAAVLVATTQPPNWGRAAWGETYFGVQAPRIPDPDASMVLMAGTDPTGYLVPYFPPQVPFLRIEGWFVGPTATSNRHIEVMRDRIAAHDGPLYALFRDVYETERMDDALKPFRLTLRRAGCVKFKPGIDANHPEKLAFCPVDRL